MLRPLAIALAVLCAGTGSALAPSARADEPATARISVQVQNLRNDEGHVLAVLHDLEDAFPGDGDRAFAKKRLKSKDGRARTSFSDLPPGTYAITVIHDEDDDGELDTNFLGMPTEGVGISNNPKARLGPPKWKSAKFEVPEGAKLNHKIQIQYL